MRLATEPCSLLLKIEIDLRNVDLLIVGDFPPATHTGISMVNALVRDILTQRGKYVYAIDESAWNYKGFFRVIRYILGSHLRLIAFLLRSKPRYVYLNVPLSFAGELRLLMSCLIVKTFSRRTEMVGHIHRGDIRHWLCNAFRNRFILRLNLKFFSKVVLLSKTFEAELLKIYPIANTVVIPNTSLLEGLQRSKKETFKANFLCISNIIRTKGLGDLVEAFNDVRLKDLHLTIAGNIYDRDFYKNISKQKLENIEFITNAERNKITDLLLNADCLILPSWNEGQPLVILEAMSLGVPIIATDVGDIPNMVGSNYPFICKSRNPNLLVEKILMFSTFEGKDRLGEQLKNIYLTRYSHKIFTNNILELFA